MAHEMIEEGKLASEKQKNIQAAAEFWADMRKTHGFLNQATDLNVQVAAMTDEDAREPGSSSKQLMEAPFESRKNPKRRKRSDDTHSLDTTTKQTKSNMAPPGEYTKPVTKTIPLGHTPASDGEDEALPTASETHTSQALEAIPVVPVKRTGEDTDKSAEPITTTAPQRDNLDTASLTAIEEETHKPNTQTGSTDEVWQSQRNRKSNKVPHSLTLGTSYKQHVETSIENLGNRKRKGGSNDEPPHPSTPLPDMTTPWPVKRSRGFTDEYVKPTTTSSRNAAPLTTHETEKRALTDVTLSPGVRITYGSHPRAAGTHDSDSPTDASPSQPDTKKCIQVGRETYAASSQPGTSYTFETGIDTGTFQGQRPQLVNTPEPGTVHSTPHKYRKPKSGTKHNPKPGNSYAGRR
jgi:hypothetical protein